MTPRYAYETECFVRSCASDRRATSTETAKPTPSPPPPVDWICELIPMTRPAESRSGPPELPWLIAASVWIASWILKLVSESIVRCSPDTTPTESDCSSPNGLPIAATGEPTSRPRVSPSRRGVSDRPLGSTFRSAMSLKMSVPMTFAGTRLSSEKRM